MTSPLIKVDNLTKEFHGKKILKGLSFSVYPGEVFGFLGPNGAGKTTTIKILSGILKPTKGEIFFDGLDLGRFPQECKRICSIVPEQPYLWEQLSGYEYLVFIGRLYGIDAKIMEGEINDLLDKFNLSSAAENMIETYSYGMKQKLIWSAALLTSPKILLLDEPFIGLDPPSVRVVKKYIEEKSRGGGAVFISTHILEIAEKLCDKIAVLDRGELVAIETQKELKNTFKNNLSLEEIFFELVKEKQPGL